jgi:hypothetical protein
LQLASVDPAFLLQAGLSASVKVDTHGEDGEHSGPKQPLAADASP